MYCKAVQNCKWSVFHVLLSCPMENQYVKIDKGCTEVKTDE